MTSADLQKNCCFDCPRASAGMARTTPIIQGLISILTSALQFPCSSSSFSET